MRKLISNAFSLQMIKNFPSEICIEEVQDFPSDAESVVGHADTAAVLGVKMNRVNVQIEKGDELYVAQIVGGRLPEGATKLPEGFCFKYLKVTLK